jgi:hypothetical protein
MTITYNAVIESELKQYARSLIPGGASTLAENLSSAVLTEVINAYSQDDANDTWPEYYQQGISIPSWVDDVVLHVSTSAAPTSVSVYGQGLSFLGTRLQARQIITNINETQVLGTPSPYGVVPPQTRQFYFQGWQY